MVKTGHLIKTYRPSHEENRMKDEGDVVKARSNYLLHPSNNLRILLQERYAWMNDFIKKEDVGMEVGAGAGISKLFIKSQSFLVTDFSDHEWLDVKNVDALSTPFDNESFDFIVSNNMLHHVPYPKTFFKEMKRILKSEGLLLIQDINASFMMRQVLRLMRHEGYDTNVDVFNESVPVTDPQDLWSANCAISNLLFDDRLKFEKEIHFFKIIKHDFSEFFIFLNSGGVIAKTFFIPSCMLFLKFLKRIDYFLVKSAPGIFALQRQVVLQKI